MNLNLTEKQQLILSYIKEFTGIHGFPPSIREIGEAFRIAPPSVLSHLKAIEKKGFIRREPFKPRCLEIINKDRAA